MSTDTKDILRRLDQGVNKADVVELCEEVDHLRQEALNEVAVRAELISKLRSADHELQNCRKELAQLREQHSLQRDEIVFLKETKSKQLDEIARLRERLRPRSIKSEPPKDGQRCLFHKPGGFWHGNYFCERVMEDHGMEWWMEYPAEPPKPDAFEEWANTQQWDDPDYRARARFVWDAAIQSTKGPA